MKPSDQEELRLANVIKLIAQLAPALRLELVVRLNTIVEAPVSRALAEYGKLHEFAAHRLIIKCKELRWDATVEEIIGCIHAHGDFAKTRNNPIGFLMHSVTQFFGSYETRGSREQREFEMRPRHSPSVEADYIRWWLNAHPNYEGSEQWLTRLSKAEKEIEKRAARRLLDDEEQ